MKTSSIIFVSAVLAVCSCNKEVSPEAGDSHVITVNADMDTEPEVSTSIYSSGDETYAFKWQKGDCISLLEMINANDGMVSPSGIPVWPDEWYVSSPLSSEATKATFSVTLHSRENPENDNYRYVGVYPSSAASGAYLESVPGSSEKHIKVMVELTNDQHPTVDSFDPEADVMVSKQEVRSAQVTGSLSLQFARVGSIAKINLSGLPAGAKLLGGEFEVGGGWVPCYISTYDATASKWEKMEKGINAIRFGYDTAVTVPSDGKVTVWLRTYAGVLQDWFSIRCEFEGGVAPYSKYVDLEILGKSIQFNQGGMTEFDVALAEESI